MDRSLKLFTWFGIPVHLHWTFFLLFPYLMWESIATQAGWADFVMKSALYVALFFCVLLHEYGHALTARRYGVKTQDIILTPIGGVARLERMPDKPFQEFVVSIAGPLVNVVIAILLLLAFKIIFFGERWELFMWHFDNLMQQADTDLTNYVAEENGPLLMILTPFFIQVLLANILLVIFNLIPAFPMDGGRIFRSLLAMRLGRVRATRIAAIVGQIIAVLFIVVGLWTQQLMLALIGFFVFTTARMEYSMVKTDDLMKRFKASDLLRPNFTRLQVNDWMQTPVNLIRQGLERSFLVFDMDEKIVGILEEESILTAMRTRDLSAEVGDYMSPRVPAVRPDDSLQQVYFLIRQQGLPMIAVVDGDNILGVIDNAGLQYFMRLQSAGEKQ